MPSGIRIYDNGGKSADRYTLVVPSIDEPGKLDMYGFNEDPYYPLGFGQYAGSYHRMGSYSHLGKLIQFEDLPDQAQRYVRETLTTPLPEGYGLPLPKKWPGKSKSGKKSKSKSKSSRGTSPSLRGVR